MDKIEKAIFSYLNRKGEVFYSEFEAYMLRRFKKLTEKELYDRMRLLEAERKVGYFNGYWHSNFPQNYYDKIFQKVNSLDEGFNPNAKIIKCVRCKKYVETNGHHTYIDLGSFHGDVCPKCYSIIKRMEALRSRKLYWKRMRSMGLDRLDDLEKPEKIVKPLFERTLYEATL